ncbi:MAG: aldo/keto reductase, partial [Deltaproteobacteria bacterium]|nr:aldo/keto reductase [Deltaproteobacteria bacterium]
GMGASERVIGRILQQTGRAVQVATKYAPTPWRVATSSLPAALGRSLDRLGLERVDLYQVHWPYTVLSLEGLMARLADEVASGRVGAVGVSNYGATQMRRAHAALAERGVPLVSNQVNYSLLHRAPENNGVLDACHELGIALIAYTPLASGALTGKYRPGGRKPIRIRRFRRAYRRLDETMPVVEELERIGREHDRSPAQVALNWLARQPGVIPIPGAKNAAQALDNARSIDFDMGDEAAARLDTLTRQ